MKQTRKNSKPRKPRKLPKDPQKTREDILRPHPRLGYDRDQLALYLMSRHVFEIAETEFRRAIWLNPYEPAFKVHLAECLYHMHRDSEARELAVKSLEQDSCNADCFRLLGMIDDRLESTQPKPI